MLTDRQNEILQAAGQLDPETEYTADDKPKLSALNEWLESGGYEPATADERDEAWAAILNQVAEQAAAEASSTSALPAAVKSAKAAVPLPVKYGTLSAALVSPAIAASSSSAA